jgi:luciferase-type oxidoreductase
MLNARSNSPLENAGYRAVAAPGKLTIGVMLPIDSYHGDTPRLDRQIALVQRAEALGFASVGIRDVPLRDPTFGDLGQVFDPWVYLGYLTAHTHRIALLTTSIVLPLRHPLHTAKAAASIDHLSGGRLILGVASGDRAVEFPAFGVDREARGELFRAQISLLRTLWANEYPQVLGHYGRLQGADLVPKPVASGIPLVVTGHSQSPLEWIARYADAWMTYPRDLANQASVANAWRAAVDLECPGTFKPIFQSYYIDLVDRSTAVSPIHLGHRLGTSELIRQLRALADIGIHHVVLNLKYGSKPADVVLEELGKDVLPLFPRGD